MNELINQPMAKKRNQTVSGVIQKYSQRLFRFIRGKVSTNADAEDIMQEVWYQFSKVIDTEQVEQASAWLFKVASNKVTDSYRKKRETALEDLAYEDEEGDILFREILFADNDTPETEMLKQVFWEELYVALEELPENQRLAFIWNEIEGKTFQEISDETGINIKTLISRKGYAVKHLRKQLAALYEEFLGY